MCLWRADCGLSQNWSCAALATQCNEGDHSELLQPLCNTQMAVCLPQHTVPTMHLSLSPVWISMMRRPTLRLVKNKEVFFNRGKKREPFWRFLLLNLSTTSRINQKRCRLDVVEHQHSRVHCLNAIRYSFPMTLSATGHDSRIQLLLQ